MSCVPTAEPTLPSEFITDLHVAWGAVDATLFLEGFLPLNSRCHSKLLFIFFHRQLLLIILLCQLPSYNLNESRWSNPGLHLHMCILDYNSFSNILHTPPFFFLFLVSAVGFVNWQTVCYLFNFYCIFPSIMSSRKKIIFLSYVS